MAIRIMGSLNLMGLHTTIIINLHSPPRHLPVQQNRVCPRQQYCISKSTIPSHNNIFYMMDNGKVPMEHDIIKEQVATAVHKSLIRLVDGGFVIHDPSGSGGQVHYHSFEPKSRTSWSDQLMDIARTSVTFPNGTNHAKGESINGSPSDVDVRAALTLYNRVKKRLYRVQDASHAEKKEPKIEKNSKKTKRSIQQKEFRFGIVSDLGTHREITSAKSFATLLSIEIEQELATESLCSTTVYENDFDPDQTLELHLSNAKHTFFDIRPSNSGIICLVSSARSRQLYAAGRVPCTQCIKWCKGVKGLWWHQLKEHGVNYSNAMEIAAGSVNGLAIVKFKEQSVLMNRASTFHDFPGLAEEKVGSYQDELGTHHSHDINIFDLVKNGDLDALIHKIENEPKTNSLLDKNGANLLHWAAGCGHLAIVSYLVKKCGFCPNEGQVGKRSFSGRTPLHWSARNGHLNVVEYLVERCNIDIEAKTLDGTTAFCWAAWQGHLDIMQYLHSYGCDVNSLNSFGCNALLWCSQGAATPEIFSWLYKSGADFCLVNDNGHSALHKAAQRGNAPACKWLVDMFMHSSSIDLDGFLLIGPDIEGACPSDLCGMNGHKSLASWLSKHECDYVCTRYSDGDLIKNAAHGPDSKCREVLDDTRLPYWLRQYDVNTGKMDSKSTRSDGVRKMKSSLTKLYCETTSNSTIDCDELPRREVNLHEID